MLELVVFIIGDVNIGLLNSNFQSILPSRQFNANKHPPSVVAKIWFSFKIIGPENILLSSRFIFHTNCFILMFKQYKFLS